MCEFLVYVRDQLATWTVLKPSDGFKTGRMALKRSGRLQDGPDGFNSVPTFFNPSRQEARRVYSRTKHGELLPQRAHI